MYQQLKNTTHKQMKTITTKTAHKYKKTNNEILSVRDLPKANCSVTFRYKKERNDID